MRFTARALVMAFTYTGTVVGAGFASGQEILQFFTKYGKYSAAAILIASVLFVWLGVKSMLIARRIAASSYADLNAHLFGERRGGRISSLMFVFLLAVSSVMLAGAGSVLEEYLGIRFETGLLLTAGLVYAVILGGLSGIKMVNAIVVPLMVVFLSGVLFVTLQSPAAEHFLRFETDEPAWRLWLSPFLYAAFNLTLAQAVLVPLGASAPDERTIRLSGFLGGSFIAAMLLASHISLSARMPGIAQFEIPMGWIVSPLGEGARLVFVLLMFAEIFTTLIANLYGITLQLSARIRLSPRILSAGLLLVCAAVGQFGFKALVSTLYPLIGFLCLFWLVRLAKERGKGNNGTKGLKTDSATEPEKRGVVQ
jgi:uncharacterized membrane protein YkvI